MRNYRLKPYVFTIAAMLLAVLMAVQTASAAGTTGSGSVSLTTLGVANSQNFDTLATTGTDIAISINGWYIFEDSTGAAADGEYRASTGSDNAGDAYSYGAAATAERALGSLRSGTVIPYFGASFTNNTGSTITSLDVAYTGEMWRAGVSSRLVADVLDFQLSTNATSLSTGTWTDHNSLDFASPKLNVTSGPLNGNDSTNQTALTYTVTGLSIANGATFWIRWSDNDISSSDDGLAVDSFSITPNGGVVDNPPTVTGTSPVDDATGVAANADITVTFSEAVTVSGAWYAISCATSGAHTATVSGGPTTFTLNPDSDFTGGEVCTVTIENTLVADQDGTVQTMAADYVFDFTITAPPAACGDPGVTFISAIQGTTDASPMDGSSVIIEGIVVGDFQDYTADPPNELSGYVVQEEVADSDGNANTSEGIFVFDGQNPATNVAVGDKVRVSGTVDEFGDVDIVDPAPDTITQIVSPLTVLVCSSGNTLPTATTIDLPVAALAGYENYESMLVTFPEELTVTEVYTLGRYGEVLLSADGRLDNPTAVVEPGAPAQAVREANILRSIMLDDALTNQNPDPLRYPEPGGLSATNTLRGGDTTTGLTGIMHYLDATEDYRIQPTGPVTWDHDNPRPTVAPAVPGDLHVVGSNTLNYFVTLDPNSNDSDTFTADDVCGPNYDGVNTATGMECRGADSAAEFARQHDKLINMLLALNADIVGLNELENIPAASPANDGTDPVLESIVDALNAATAPGTYAFIDTGTIGGDAIKVGLIYKPDSVTPVGSFNILDSSYDPAFIDNRNRPVLAQTFEDDNGSIFTVAVAHLKSKGCPDPGDLPVGDPNYDQGDGQGCWNPVRTAAAEVMVDWFAEPTVNNGDPDILLVGDLNSYAKEDPIDVFVDAGYVDLAATLTDPYSYVFDGEWGYLDYAMASPTLAAQVAGVAEWHINADEPIVLDYNLEFKSNAQDISFYSPDPFRVSDHDPIIVGLNPTVPDTTGPDVTINQASGQFDPTSSSPILFTVVFTETVTGFGDALSDVDLSASTAPGTLTYTVTETGPMDGTTYEVAVSGMTGDGLVIATVPAGVAQDAATNGNTASTSTDNTVTYVAPVAEAFLYVSTLTAGAVGPLSYGSEDILAWDGNAWSVWFDGADANLTPNGKAMHNINAFYIPEVIPAANSDEVLLSFAQNARIVPGISGKVDGMDLVTWDGSAFSLTFDGQDVGLTVLTNEKIDSLHELDPALAPAAVQQAAGGSCLRYFLISTQAAGQVPNYNATPLKFGGEDVLGFCATQLGATTAGKWHKFLDGSNEGVAPDAITSLSASADGQTLYLTTRSTFVVDSATGGHSMVYKYEFASGEFSGPYFIAADHGLTTKVDGLQVEGDLP